MDVKLVEEEKINKMLKTIKELSQSSNTEDNIKAVVLAWCLEDMDLMDKPEEKKRVPPETKLNGTKSKLTQFNYTEEGEEKSMANTIAEAMIQRWVDCNFRPGSMNVEMNGRKAKITDKNGDSIYLAYNPEKREIEEYEPEEF